MAEQSWETTPTWPANADAVYIAARRRLVREEAALMHQIERVASLRRSLPAGARVADYPLTERILDANGGWIRNQPVTFHELVPTDRPLVIYHLMFAPGAQEACPACSMWVDGFNGVAPHLERHMAFAVVAKTPLEDLTRWSRVRGWNQLRLVSSHGTSFNRDLNAETASGDQVEGISVFTRDGDTVHHRYTAHAALDGYMDERGIDLLSPVWNVLDLLPGGRGDWYPGNDYILERAMANR